MVKNKIYILKLLAKTYRLTQKSIILTQMLLPLPA